MSDNQELLSAEQREYYENETGKKLPDGATWGSLTGEQKAILSDALAPKTTETAEFSDKFKEKEQDGAYVENKSPMSLEEAVTKSQDKELYNANPNELAEMSNVLREATINGNDDAAKSYIAVRNAMNEKLQAYANGEIETPIEWAGGMQAMLRAAKENLPEQAPYKEEPIVALDKEQAKAIVANEEKSLGEMDLKSLAALKLAQTNNPQEIDNERINNAIKFKLSEIAEMKQSEQLNKEDFAAVQVLLETAPVSMKTDSAGKDFEIFKSVENKLYTSRQEVNKPIEEPQMGELAAHCEKKLQEFTDTYDKEHGLWLMDSQDAERVSENIEAMSTMGLDALDKQEYKEEPVKPMSREDAEKAMVELRNGKEFDVKELASLSAANAFGTTGPDYETLQKAIVGKLSSLNKKLPAEDLSSVDFLLEQSTHYPESMFPNKNYKKAKSTLLKNREEQKKITKPKYPEMEDAVALVDNLEFTNGLGLFGKKKAKDNDDLKAQFVESIRLQTMQSMAGSKDTPINPEEFNKEFAANIVAEVGRLSGVQTVVDGKTQSIDNFAKGKKIKVSKDTLTGYLAEQSNARDGFAHRLETKVGKKNKGVETLRNLSKKLDARMPAKSFSLLKSLGKSAAWSGAYYVAGATMGPAGVALVATASLANQAIKLRKEYKKQKAEMAKKGKKLKLTSFLKKNKMAIAGAALTALGAATAGLTAAEIPQSIVQSLQEAKTASGITLGVANTVKSFRDARKSGAGIGKAILSASAAGISTGWAIIAGQNHHDANSEVSTPTTEAPQPMLDRDHDGISDYIDRDGGDGWANVVEKEQEPPVQSQEIQKEPETPKVQQEPTVKQEPVVQNIPEPEKVQEMPEALKQPLEQPSLASMVQQDENRIVIDPHSHKIVEFSLDEQGNVHTQGAENISGSNELHDAIVNKVVSGNIGNLDEKEVAFVEKHTSQEVAQDILRADAMSRPMEETQTTLAPTLQAQEDIKLNKIQVSPEEAKQIRAEAMEKPMEAPKTSVTAALSTQEKMAALRGGISVTEAQEAKISTHTPSAEKTPTATNAQIGAWKRNSTLGY